MQATRLGRYLWALVTGYGLTFLTQLVGIWLVPFTLVYISDTEYAISAVSNNLIIWFHLFDIGFTTGLGVYLSQRSSNIQAEEVNRYTTSIFFVQLGLALVAMLIGGAVAFLFPLFFSVPQALQATSIRFFAVLSVGFGLLLASQTFSALIVAHQLGYADNLIRTLSFIVRTLITVLCLMRGWGLMAIAVANFAANGVLLFLLYLRARRVIVGFQIAPRYFSWDVVRSMVGVSGWFTLGAAAGFVIRNLDSVLTARLVSLEVVTHLVITSKLYILGYLILWQFITLARPILGELIGREQHSEAFETYSGLFNLSVGSAILMAMVFAGVNGHFIALWVGTEYYGGVAMEIALGLNLCITIGSLLHRTTLEALFLARSQAINQVLEAVLNVSLALLLARWFGVVGVLLSTAIAATLSSVFYLPYLIYRQFNQPYPYFFTSSLLRLIAFFVTLLPLSLLADALLDQMNSWITLFGVTLTVGALGLLLLWSIVLNNKLRSQARLQLQMAYRRISQANP